MCDIAGKTLLPAGLMQQMRVAAPRDRRPMSAKIATPIEEALRKAVDLPKRKRSLSQYLY
jgi:hypothetical protein